MVKTKTAQEPSSPVTKTKTAQEPSSPLAKTKAARDPQPRPPRAKAVEAEVETVQPLPIPAGSTKSTSAPPELNVAEHEQVQASVQSVQIHPQPDLSDHIPDQPSLAVNAYPLPRAAATTSPLTEHIAPVPAPPVELPRPTPTPPVLAVPQTSAVPAAVTAPTPSLVEAPPAPVVQPSPVVILTPITLTMLAPPAPVVQAPVTLTPTKASSMAVPTPAVAAVHLPPALEAPPTPSQSIAPPAPAQASSQPAQPEHPGPAAQEARTPTSLKARLTTGRLSQSAETSENPPPRPATVRHIACCFLRYDQTLHGTGPSESFWRTEHTHGYICQVLSLHSKA